ncbi:MAG: hypothetical protein H0U52_05580, partial [Chloroflexi bacterium]|nr:hypothetical protein [Chloroflexota bacterium]
PPPAVGPAPGGAPKPAIDPPPAVGPAAAFERRPWLERIGLAAIALVMGAMFGLVAFAAGAGGEWILAAMSAVGAFMTLAVGLSTLVRG